MANWYYYNASGEKVGPVRGRDLTALVKDGTVTPDTIIESEDGRQVPASQVQGLTFVPATAVPAPAQFWYYDAAGQKIGPVGSRDLAALAKNGGILPDTIVETARGQQGKARQLKGLEFAPSPFAPTNPFGSSANPFNSSPSFPIAQSPFTQQAPMPMAATFCTNCGQPVNPAAAACLACGASPKGHKRFCGNCGVPISEVQVICVKCGAAVAGHQQQSQGGGNAFLDIFALKPDAPLKSRTAYICIALFLFGGIGMHNFYAGRVKVAFLQLVIGLLGLIIFAVPTLVVWAWAILDCIQVKEDGLGRPFV
ncbi:hypothetical protein FACS1894189_1000 [Planctomycetales bacterium]|nr:hypothetical protein FACS1894189_1000 [Planctomycetales bacterium]